MATGSYGAVLQHFHRLFGLGTVAGLTEWQLLHRYVTRRDEAAFEALVARHGPMVLGVCRRVLDEPHDVEDAFQATFLVLVRRAASLRERDILAHWLYGVAFRVALRARSTAARRRSRERPGGEAEAMQPETNTQDAPDLRRVIDEELTRLPDRYRRPVVLCYLEGLTQAEAAQQLRWPIGTVKGRLSRARELLRDRLTRRGLSLPAGALVAALSSDASAAVPVTLLDSTVKAAMLVAAGQAALAGVISAQVAALMEGVLNAMFLTKLRLAAALLACGLIVTSAGVLGMPALRGGQGNEAAKAAIPQAAPEQAKPVTFETGKPKGVATEIGKTGEPNSPSRIDALAQARLKAAQNAYHQGEADYKVGRITLDRYLETSKLILEAERDLNPTKAGQVSAFRAHLDRVAAIEKGERDVLYVGRGTPFDVAEVEYARREAEYWLERAKVGPSPAGSATIESDEPGKDPRSLSIIAKLNELIALSFADETPLEDVLRFIKDATASDDMPKGVTFYVDPLGLQEAEKTMQSVVTIDLEGVPLKRTLQLLLGQLGLAYIVQDGMIYITSDSAEQFPLGPSIRQTTPTVKMLDRFERGEMSVDEMKQYLEQLKARREVEAILHPPAKEGGVGGIQ